MVVFQEKIAQNLQLDDMTIVIGRSSTISMLEIKKITAIKKNYSENGIHEDIFGSNPHLNVELYSL